MVAKFQLAILATTAVSPVIVVGENPTYYVFGETSSSGSVSNKKCNKPDTTNSVCLDSDLKTTAESNTIFTSNSVQRDWTDPTAGDYVYAYINSNEVSSTTVCDNTQNCYNHPNVVNNAVAQIQAPADLNTSSATPFAKNCLTQWMLGADPSTNIFSTLSHPHGLHATSMQNCQYQCMHDKDCSFWSFDVGATASKDINCYLQTYQAEVVAMGNEVYGYLNLCGFHNNTPETAMVAICPDGTTTICAIANGKYISGDTVCEEAKTPSLEYLQTGYICKNHGHHSGTTSQITIIGTAAIAAFIAIVLITTNL